MKLSHSVALLVSVVLSSQLKAGLVEAEQAFARADYQTASAEFLALSSEGQPVADYYLGRMYKEGLGVDQDATKAIKFFEKADIAYHPEATVELAKMAIKGEGTVQNVDLGLQYLKKAAYAGSANALYELGLLYEDGNGVPKNYTYAFGFYYMGALKGDSRAQLKTAQYYLAGRGIPQDFEAAMTWYVRAANQGYVPAQQEWADIRVNNPRLKNPLDAYSWYSILAAYNTNEVGAEAARRRDALSRSFEGQILTAQQKKIMSWRPVMAAYSVPVKEVQTAVLPIIPGFNDDETTKNRLESGAALHSDGSIYGITEQIIEKALKENNKNLIEQKVSEAITHEQKGVYGFYADLLRGRFNDEAAALEWYKKGAENEDAYSQYQLGKSYCEGRGIEADISACYGWLLLASKKADQNLSLTVNKAIESVEMAATEEEIQKGKSFVESHQQKVPEEEKQKPSLFNIF